MPSREPQGKSLGRAVDNIVKGRRKELADEDSSENGGESSYTDAIDD
jgi:hypothetical protein